MKEVTLNGKEQKRLIVLNEMVAGRLTGEEAAALLGLSVRHTRRLLAGYRREGAAALAHGNRGREPANKLDEEVEEAIVDLARESYADYNDLLLDLPDESLWEEMVALYPKRPAAAMEDGAGEIDTDGSEQETADDAR